MQGGIMGAALFGAVVGGILGAILTYLAEKLLGNKVSAKTKNIFVWGGVLVGYAVIKAFLERQ